MPESPSEAFLLWHEAALTGQWRELLNAPGTLDVLLALWMLQAYLLKPQTAQDRDVAARVAIAAGWGQ